MQLRLMRGVFSNVNDINLFLMIFPRMSLHSKLVPVQYREYEYGLLCNIGIRCMRISQNLAKIFLAFFLSFFSALLLSLTFSFHILPGCCEKLCVNYGQSLEMDLDQLWP